MAFSSLAVTRSVGDSLWRANDDWKRDKTRDGEGQLAMDEALSDFSRTKGCVGITSEPEWYSCCLQGGSSGGEQVVHWAVSTNAPSEVLSIPKIFRPTDDLRFYLVVGSDGFWESSAVSSISNRIDDNGQSTPSANELIEVAAAAIGTTPHDDTTVVVAELLVDADGLVAAGSTISEKTSTKYRTARRSQSDQEDRHPPPRKGDLDYLFAKVY
jgi:serine/threonine protein phosphatase PrpC